MTEKLQCTAAELLAVLSARELRNGQVVFAGVGTPLLAASLAQRVDCPNLTILFEGGVVGASIVPGKMPPSTNDQRCAKMANMVLGSSEVMLLMQRGYVDYGFLGGAQIDQFGNLNSSFIGDFTNPKIRLPGSGGANDIASLTKFIVSIRHEKRRFVSKVDFVTTPGFVNGGNSRYESGLLRGGCYRVITDLGVFGFDEKTRRMKVLAVNPSSSLEEIRDNTGFDLLVDDKVGTTAPATQRELAILRDLDPLRIFTA
jgi:glutaconate CoA-transferase, subunit B